MSTKEYTAFMKKGTFNMKYAIVYSSKTGNTKLLATTIQECLPQEDCIYFGEPSEEALAADYIFAGFWTDKGSCDGEAKKFLKKLDEKKVFLFGTAGFGEDASYFEKILEKTRKVLKDSVIVEGTYMCQGKMPMSVRERYEKMRKVPGLPMDVDKMIENFDKALSHPDQADLDALKEAINA